jgi:hypothetical protein
VRLGELADGLQRALAEIPRAEDFQPLADHLYAFASLAPRLLETLQDVPRVLAPLEATARALQEVSETLHFAHDSFKDSLLRLPHPEDFEPLAGPLREFARVSPALTESLAEMMRLMRPLAAAAAQGVPAPAPSAPAAAPLTGDAHTLAAAAERVRHARRAILAALAGLPREREYARLAAQLRELASVSPSLLEWLGEVQGVSAPLEASVERLRAAAAQLAAAEQAFGAGDAGTRETDAGPAALADDLLTLARALRARLADGPPGAPSGALLAALAAVQRELEQATRTLASTMMTR